MKYIRDTYGVPAKRGGRVERIDCAGAIQGGRIVGTRYGWLRVMLDGQFRAQLFHPTDGMRYLEPPK